MHNVPLQAGYNAGDVRNFYELPFSGTADVTQIAENSNVGHPGEVPGRWILRLDNGECPRLGERSKVEYGVGCVTRVAINSTPNTILLRMTCLNLRAKYSNILVELVAEWLRHRT